MTHPRADIPVLADDPVKNHPTRGEQLDIMATAAAAILKPGDAVIDVGIGVGYALRFVCERVKGLKVTGVDLKPESLAQARTALTPLAASVTLVEGDLSRIGELAVPPGPYKCAVSVLTFHDLDDAAKQRVIAWVAKALAPGGCFLFLDRVRLDKAPLFPLQVALWDRMQRVYGFSMRRAETHAAYIADLGEKNRPALFADYTRWFADAGLVADCLHRHGNIALFAAAKP